MGQFERRDSRWEGTIEAINTDRSLSGARVVGPIDPALSEPAIARFIRRFAAGEVSQADLQRPWTITSPPGIPPKLRPFLQSSGDFEKLAQALRTTPGLLWHPLVFSTIKYLRQVVRQNYIDNLGDGFDTPAYEHLRKLIEAAAQGMLGKTWSLVSKKGVGRPRKRGNSELLDDVTRYEDILDLLPDKEHVKRQRDESFVQWCDRIAPLVREAWEQSSLSWEMIPWVRPPVLPRAKTTASRLLDLIPPQLTRKEEDDLLQEPFVDLTRPVPLPEKRLRVLVSNAFRSSKRKGERRGDSIRTRLAYWLIRERLRHEDPTSTLSVDAVRRRIERARKATEAL
jgi:hypothetical protein